MPSNSAANKRIAMNTIFLYIRLVFVMLISIYTVRLVLEALGVMDYGIFNVVAGFVSMFGFLNTNIAGCIQRFYNYQIGRFGEGSLKKTFTIACVVQVMLAILVVVLAESAGLWYIKNHMVIPPERLEAALWIFHCSIISMVFNIFVTPFQGAVMAFERINFFAIISVLDAVLKYAIAFLLIRTDGDRLVIYGTLIVSINAFNLTAYSLYAFLCFKVIRFIRKIDFSQLKEMISFSGWGLFGVFAVMIMGQGNSMVLNLFFGPVVNAANGVGVQINHAITQFSSSIFTASRPQIIEAYAARNATRSINLFFSCSKMGYYLLLMLSIPVIMEMNFILHIWLGENVPEHTAMFASLTMVRALVGQFHHIHTIMFHASGKVKWFNLVTFFFYSGSVPISYLVLCFCENPMLVYIVKILMVVMCVFWCILAFNRIAHYGVRNYWNLVIMPALLIGVVAFLPNIALVYCLPESFIRAALSFMISLIVVPTLVYRFSLQSHEKELVQTWFLSRLRLR